MSVITQFGVQDCYKFTHDGDEGDHAFFAVLDEPPEELSQVWIEAARQSRAKNQSLSVRLWIASLRSR